MLYGNTSLSDLGNARFKMYGNVICLEEIAQIARIREADTGCCYKVVLHFNDNGLFAVKIEIVRDLASGKTSADNDNVLTDSLIAEQVVNSLDSRISALDRYSLCDSAGRDDDLIGAERLYVLDLCIELNVNRPYLCRKLSFRAYKLPFLR